ncbi:ClpP-like prohead protease/major capsid protein fusion protein [Janthinobacterium sp. RT4P48]|uniref:ClpP-like prohead protease/major capsid protein fusion protein n=1 Tax=Janthinobacterium sp. RT4P48 TaxID=3424188 RepID=UPI003F1FBE2B
MPSPKATIAATPEKWYTIRAQARPAAGVNAQARAEILIYGDIGESWYGDTVAAKDFVREVSLLEVDALTVRINSYGGSVTDGVAIYNALKRHPAAVTTVIDGIAASIASLIAMAGDTVEMADNAMLMIHAPWMYTGGNSASLREDADMLDSYAEAMATSYIAKTGGDKAEILALLQDGKDHWYTAEEAISAKFADAAIAALPLAASASLNPSIQARYASFPLPVGPAASVAPQPTITPKENAVPQPLNPQAVEPSAAAVAAKQIAAAALEADKTRRTSISAAFAKFASTEGVSALAAVCADDTECTVEAANTKLLAHLGAGASSAGGGRIVTLEDERDKFRAGVEASVLARSSLGKDDRSNNFRSYSMLDIARACLDQAGINAKGMDKMKLVAAAFTHTGSDFPMLLGNIAEKAMLKGYEEAEETFQLWTSKGTLGDFKVGKRVDLNTFPSLDKIQDGAEYTYADIGERGESVQLATYGKMFSLTRQAIINDDLDAFTKIPKRLGRAAIRTIGDLVYAILTSNPRMSDGIALFHADHKNLLPGAGISTATVDALQVAMGLQKDGTGSILNLDVKTLIVPRALRGTANVVRESEFEVGAANKNNTVPNSVRSTFDVVADARLDANSATAWYGVASKDQHDCIEVQYLDGNEAPTLEQQNGWHVDGVEFKVRMDAGVKALDFRTMAKNPGA